MTVTKAECLRKQRRLQAKRYYDKIYKVYKTPKISRPLSVWDKTPDEIRLAKNKYARERRQKARDVIAQKEFTCLSAPTNEVMIPGITC